jgi:hypothetical protein
VRCFPAGKYLIYYRKTRRGTDILYIFTALGISGVPSITKKVKRNGVFSDALQVPLGSKLGKLRAKNGRI